MTPDELRALADALPEGVHWSDPITPEMLAEAIKRFCAAAPAAPHHAMLDSHRRLVEQAIHTAEHPSGMSTHDGKARIDASVLRRMLAIIDSLPAAPQAEPKRDSVPIPHDADQAVLMTMVGVAWLQANAPDRLSTRFSELIKQRGGSDAE